VVSIGGFILGLRKTVERGWGYSSILAIWVGRAQRQKILCLRTPISEKLHNFIDVKGGEERRGKDPRGGFFKAFFGREKNTSYMKETISGGKSSCLKKGGGGGWD